MPPIIQQSISPQPLRRSLTCEKTFFVFFVVGFNAAPKAHANPAGGAGWRRCAPLGIDSYNLVSIS
jgi:hypothetical protein